VEKVCIGCCSPRQQATVRQQQQKQPHALECRAPNLPCAHLHHSLQADSLAAPLVMLVAVHPCKHSTPKQQRKRETDHVTLSNFAMLVDVSWGGHAGSPAAALGHQLRRRRLLPRTLHHDRLVVVQQLAALNLSAAEAHLQAAACIPANHLEQGQSHCQQQYAMAAVAWFLAVGCKHAARLGSAATRSLPLLTWQASISSTLLLLVLLLSLLPLLPLPVKASSRR
jgi:hypothetical protein